MSEKGLGFEDFVKDVELPNREFAEGINEFLSENGYKLKVTRAKNGYVASYNEPKTKRVALNFVFRKKGLTARIYGDYVNSYSDFPDTLPEEMAAEIKKAPPCRRLLDPAECNSRCPMGYDFILGGERLKKCRYNCFLFTVNDKSAPFIRKFVENEVMARSGRNGQLAT